MAYSAGAFVLEIEGQVAGYLSDAAGGEPVAPAVSEPPDANKVVRKHPGSVGYTLIQLSFGSEMELPLYQWMADMLNGTQSAKGGAIVFYDYNLIEETRIEFSGSLITQIIFPALDAASNETALFRVTLQPEVTHFSFAKAGIKGPVKSHKVKRRLLASNFRLAISDLPTNKIRRIESIIANQAVTRDANTAVMQPLDISNLVFSLPQADSTPMYEWFSDFVAIGNSSKETNGTLELLDTTLSNILFTLTLSNLGVIRVHRETQNSGAGLLTRVDVEAYVEQLAFTTVQHVSASPVTAPSIAIETILEALSIRSKEGTAYSLKSTATEQTTVDPKVIARRLKAAPSAVELPSKHEAGILVGTQWATQLASLKEVQQIADLTSREWNAVRLEQNHSLVAKLVAEGILQPPHDGPIDLTRDGFTEGLTIGASRVMQSVTPALDLSDSGQLSNLQLQTLITSLQDTEVAASNAAQRAAETANKTACTSAGKRAMEMFLTAYRNNLVNSKLKERDCADASELREALRYFEAGAHPLGATNEANLANQDIMAMAFLVMMEAAKSAREDLKAIMDGVKAINKAKDGLRQLLRKVNRDVVRNAGQMDGRPQLDFSTGLGSEENYHRVQIPVPDEQASTGVAFIVTDLCPGPITTKGDIDAAKETIKNKLDSLSEMGEMESLRLQMAVDRLSKLMSTLSNLLKKMSDTAASITQNIK